MLLHQLELLRWRMHIFYTRSARFAFLAVHSVSGLIDELLKAVRYVENFFIL